MPSRPHKWPPPSLPVPFQAQYRAPCCWQDLQKRSFLNIIVVWRHDEPSLTRDGYLRPVLRVHPFPIDESLRLDQGGIREPKLR